MISDKDKLQIARDLRNSTDALAAELDNRHIEDKEFLKLMLNHYTAVACAVIELGMTDVT